MKKLNKKFLFVAAGALLLSAGAFTAHALAKTNVQNSDLMIANLEALADGETDLEDGYNLCYWESRVKTGYTYYDCGQCSKKIYNEQGKGNITKCSLN